jgi:hypothetical protein
VAAVRYKRVSIATLRKILGLDEITDNSGKVVQQAPLELWANLKQRALDVALKEINKHSDIQLELEFVGRGAFRKVLSLGFRVTRTCAMRVTNSAAPRKSLSPQAHSHRSCFFGHGIDHTV